MPYSLIRLMAVLASAALLSACQSVTNILPIKDTVEEFDGRYINTLTVEKWSPNLVQSSSNEFDIPSGEVLILREYAGLAPNRRLDRYLTGIAKKLLEHSPVSHVPFEIELVADNLYGNSKAMPDGTIAINMETLRVLKTEDQVAALLAHELSHLILGHHNNQWISQFRDRMEGAATVGLSLANSAAQIGKQQGHDTSKIQRIILYTQIALAVTREAIDTGLVPAWDREQEDYADILAVDLLVKAGYSPYAVDEFLGALADVTAKNASRAEKAEKAKKENEKAMKAAFATGKTDAVVAAIASIISKSFKSMRARLRKDHRQLVARQDSILAYIEREYADLPIREDTVRPWTKVKKSRGVHTTLAAYDHVWRADNLVADGNYDAAYRELRKGFRGTVRQHAAPWYVFGKIRKGQGRTKDAIENLNVGIKRPGSGYILQSTLTDLLMAQGQWRSADRVATRAWNQYENPDDMVPMLIKIKKKSGKAKEASKLNVRCQTKHRRVAGECQKAIKDET